MYKFTRYCYISDEKLDILRFINMESTKEKVALITGAAGAIGLAMAKELLKNDAKGIAIVDSCEAAGLRAVEEIVTIFGSGKVIYIKTDVTNEKELEDAFETTIKTYKQLDIVINNAGIVDEITWKNMIAVNLVAVIEGTYLAMQKYLPKYKTGAEGIIVNTASILGLDVMSSAPVYCATKHGIVGLGKVLGSEDFYKKYKVRILTICPGVVLTQLSSTSGTSKFFFPQDKVEDDFKKLNGEPQPPERVGEALIDIIRVGKNGSLWVTEHNESPYEVVVPDRGALKV